jgi:hypothetical protein
MVQSAENNLGNGKVVIDFLKVSYILLNMNNASIVQWSERGTLNSFVAGSNPAGSATK